MNARMAPQSIAPFFDAPVTAQQDRQVRRLLSAFFHTEQQVPRLCAGNAGFGGVVEHARAAGLYLGDICASRQLRLEDSETVLLSSSSPFDVLQREVELVQRLSEVSSSAGDEGLHGFCESWLRARVAHLAV